MDGKRVPIVSVQFFNDVYLSDDQNNNKVVYDYLFSEKCLNSSRFLLFCHNNIKEYIAFEQPVFFDILGRFGDSLLEERF